MTPDQLSERQLLAAYVSAGAAVFQACGAIGAIVASIVLARQSVSREEAARAAAAERERQADLAAERRAREADQAAEDRAFRTIALQRSATEEDAKIKHDDVVDRALGLAGRALATLTSKITEWDRMATAGDNGYYGDGGFNSPELGDVRQALHALKDEALVDPELNLAISQFLRESDPTRGGFTGMASAQADHLRRYEVLWHEAFSRIEARRRPRENDVVAQN